MIGGHELAIGCCMIRFNLVLHTYYLSLNVKASGKQRCLYNYLYRVIKLPAAKGYGHLSENRAFWLLPL